MKKKEAMKEDSSNVLELHVTALPRVEVPVRTAYNQWTQFEEFPSFMDGIQAVTQLDDRRLHWKAEIGGKTVEWDAEITEQHPDQRIAWKSLNGDARALR